MLPGAPPPRRLVLSAQPSVNDDPIMLAMYVPRTLAVLLGVVSIGVGMVGLATDDIKTV